jgi:hypothetical protein
LKYEVKKASICFQKGKGQCVLDKGNAIQETLESEAVKLCLLSATICLYGAGFSALSVANTKF